MILAIDDMRGYQKWETFLRPILQRLKQIDVRLRYNNHAITPSSQTERRGDAGPVRVLLGGGHAPAAFSIHAKGNNS